MFSEKTGMSEVEKALKTDELTSKLSKLSVRNVNKRIKRRDLKIAKLQYQVYIERIKFVLASD